LSGNTNAEAVELLKQNPDKISWIDLSSNANAGGRLLKETQQNQLGCLSREHGSHETAETELLHD
jgi:hypothetical protein